MNKKLLAVAIGAAFAAPMLAQAEITVGGTVHMDAGYIDTGVGGAEQTKMWNISSNASNFVINANEDLGGGMKAVVKILEYVRFDNLDGTTAKTNRLTDGDAYAGISAGFGTILLGSMESPNKMLGRSVDLFGNAIGDSRNLDMNNVRLSNMVNYTSPKMAGVSVEVAHSTGQAATGVSALNSAKVNDIAVKYSGGPVSVGLGRQVWADQGAGGTDDDETYTTLVGSFGPFGPAKVNVAYQKRENIGNVATTESAVMGLGASVKVGGSGLVKLQFYKLTADSVGSSLESKVVAVGYDHSLSKATTAYVAIAKADNDVGANKGMAGGGHGDNVANLDGGSQNGLSLGLIVKF